MPRKKKVFNTQGEEMSHITVRIPTVLLNFVTTIGIHEKRTRNNMINVLIERGMAACEVPDAKA